MSYFLGNILRSTEASRPCLFLKISAINSGQHGFELDLEQAEENSYLLSE